MEASGIRKGKQSVPETPKGEDDPRPRAQGAEDRKTSKAYVWLSSELGREPSEEEVAETLGWEVERVREVKDAMPEDVVSLHRPLSLEEGTPWLGHFLQDERVLDTPGAVIREEETVLLKEA